MDNSILDTTKKILGLDSNYHAFDSDVIIHINATFSTLQQLGVGPDEGFEIEDSEVGWDDYPVDLVTLNLVKSFMYLKVRMLFDPPTTSYLLDAAQRQIDEFTWRLCAVKESIPPVVSEV